MVMVAVFSVDVGVYELKTAQVVAVG